LGWTAQQSGMLMIPSALTTAFMMPVIGNLLQKGVPQKLLVSMGMLLFAGFTYWGFTIITPDTGAENFFWMLILRGCGMGMLFIPITALSLSNLKGQQIGQGAAFTGMMRQLGGSFGIALITTYISRRNMQHRSDLVSKLSTDNPTVMQQLAGYQHNFEAKGKAANTALKTAYQMMDLSVSKQSVVLSYMEVFLYLGVLFLICIPFIMMVKANKSKVDLSAAAH
jgi:DHA2 family multidrug resistance protein